MKKRIFVSMAILISIIFSFSLCFAANPLTDASDSVKNAVNKTEDTVENAANDVGGAMKKSTNKAENTMNNVGNSAIGMENNTEKNMNNKASSSRNDTYTATRTSAEGNETFMGLNATSWTWLILGIAAIAIIAVVWYYSNQITSNHDNSRRD